MLNRRKYILCLDHVVTKLTKLFSAQGPLVLDIVKTKQGGNILEKY